MLAQNLTFLNTLQTLFDLRMRFSSKIDVQYKRKEL